MIRNRNIIFASGIQSGGSGRKSPNRVWFIYTLSDPETDEICYVGQTINIDNRYDTHCRCSASTTKNIPLTKWIQGLRACGMKPIMTIIARLPEAEHAGMTTIVELQQMIRIWNEGHPVLNSYFRYTVTFKRKWLVRINNSKMNKRVNVI